MFKKGLGKFGEVMYVVADKTPTTLLVITASVSASLLYAKGVSNTVNSINEQAEKAGYDAIIKIV